MPQAINQASLPNMDPDEIALIAFDYSGQIQCCQTIITVISVVCVVAPESPVQDPTPQLRVIGNTVIVGSPINAAPAQAFTQLIGNMLAGVIYIVTGLVATSDDQQLSLWFKVTCASPT